MNDLQKRWAMFLGLCIPARFLLAYIASKLSPKHLKIMGIILTIPIVGWVFIYLTKSRQTGGETLGAPIWWDHLRPIHAALYFIFVLMALRGEKKAYIPLVIDPVIGLLAFLHQHFIR